jgi:hypothetical protein
VSYILLLISYYFLHCWNFQDRLATVVLWGFVLVLSTRVEINTCITIHNLLVKNHTWWQQ